MNRLRFNGKGFAYFKILIVDVIAVFASLGLLYPLAKKRECRYLCSRTYLDNVPFSYNGSARTHFKGYLKTWFAFVLFYSLFFSYQALVAAAPPVWQLGILFFLGIFVFVYTATLYSLMINSSLKFYTNNISCGTLTFSYNGKISELLFKNIAGQFLATVTLGIYTAWYRTQLFQYIAEHLRFGNLRFSYKGSGKELFRIYLKGFLLSIVTFGIYGIWNYKNTYNYTVNQIVVRKGEQEFCLQSDANIRDVFEMLIGNIFLVIFTLGLGTAWAFNRYNTFLINHCLIPAELSIEESQEVQQEDVRTNWLDRLDPKFYL